MFLFREKAGASELLGGVLVVSAQIKRITGKLIMKPDEALKGGGVEGREDKLKANMLTVVGGSL